ncbi:MAG: DUF4266 domain-containing protein [Lewinellaceae bacterium]|nr:DUF4266 domain-containing protein [Lewinellaceae bacterium]
MKLTNAINKKITVDKVVLLILALLSLSACETVRPYQRAYLNDRNMALKPLPEAAYEMNIEGYREGASGANGGKGGGGCGCN